MNPNKMKVMEFNRTRKPVVGTEFINASGTQIEKVDNFKLLGVHLDSSLNWNYHIDRAVEKGRKTLFITSHYLRLNWGINAHLALQVYKQIVLPRVTFASFIWSHRLDVKYLRSKFEKLQRLALIMCTGAFRSTPSADIDYILGIPSIKLLCQKLATEECNRLIINNLWPQYPGNIGHRSIIQLRNSLNHNNIPDTISKQINSGRRYEIIIRDRDTWDDGLSKTDPVYHWYSDGSKSEIGVGSGIFNPSSGAERCFKLSDNATVMQAELYGIQECARQCINENITHKQIIILSDSQAAIQALAKATFDSTSVRNCVKSLQAVSVLNKVQIRWVPGHSGISGNEAADRLANLGAAKQNVDLIAPETPATFDNAIAQWLEDSRAREWREKFPARSEYAYSMIAAAARNSKDLWKLKRNKIRAIISLVSGHARLNKYISYTNHEHSALCRYCGNEDEKIEHLIMECEQLDDIRLETVGSWSLDYHELEDIPISDMIRFSKSAGFYQILACKHPMGAVQT